MLVRVAATSVNLSDWETLRGSPLYSRPGGARPSCRGSRTHANPLLTHSTPSWLTMSALDAQEAVDVPLNNEERQLLRAGLAEWGGPAHCTDEFAVAMGFKDVEDLHSQRDRLSLALADGEPLSPADWSRTLLATEVAFASDVIGSGVEWPSTTGFPDADTIKLLRGVQRRMAGSGVWRRK